MIKIMALLFVMVAPTLAGIAVVGVLAMSSPIDGGASFGQQGSTILMLVVGAFLVALPISFVVARMISKSIADRAGNA